MERKTQYVLVLILSCLLTAALFVVCFCIGENGLIHTVENALQRNEASDNVQTDDEERQAKLATLAEYRELLASKYMSVVDKSTPAVSADESTLETVEGARMEAEAAAQLVKFLAAIRQAGITVTVDDGYRTLSAQTALYESAVSSMLSAGHSESEARARAGKIRAQSGYSEHHTGLAVDLYETSSVSASEMKKTALYQYAKEHCAEYGFIISYSDTNAVLTGYDEKPWHFRYVGGEKQARYIMEKDITLAAYVSFLKSSVASLEQQLGQ